MMNQYQQAFDRTLGMLALLQADESAAFCRQLIPEINRRILNSKQGISAQSDAMNCEVGTTPQ
jgi:hypothetical protein